MANIIDYLDWRGDIPFSVSPFNEVDNLIFSELSFINFDRILSERVADGGLPLEEAVARYFEANPSDQISLGLIVPAEIRTLLRRMAQSERYRHLTLSGYVDHIDENRQKQFAALTVEINEQELFVAFRGTDDTLVGWKENFNMSFLEAIPAQKDAVAYLNQVAADTRHPRIYVGGHSKGGNLAIYAAVHCDTAVKSRIVQVFSNDGPGYRREVVVSKAYKEMENRIVNVIPQTSVIGRLLEHDNRYRVIQSSASGLWQHDGFSWEVKGTQFVPAPALSQESEMIERSIKKWIAEMDEEKRETFVDALYKVLTATNAKTLTELTGDKNWFWKLMTSSDAETRKTVFGALTQLTGEAGKLWAETIFPTLIRGRKSIEEPTATSLASTTISSVSNKPQKSTETKLGGVKSSTKKAPAARPERKTNACSAVTQAPKKKDARTVIQEIIAPPKKGMEKATAKKPCEHLPVKKVSPVASRSPLVEQSKQTNK